MRFHLRRTLSYLLLAVGGIMFLSTMDWPTEERRRDGERDGGALAGESGARSGATARAFDAQNSAGAIWSPGSDPYNDRIVDQMLHVPEGYTRRAPLKHIFVPGGITDTPMGQRKFIEQNCPVDRCALTTHRPAAADAVLIQNSKDGAWLRKQPGQIWILWLLESPMNSVGLAWLKDNVNWTATYRADSTIVTPYEKFVPYANWSGRPLPDAPLRNYAEGKTKLVAWFVSNCNAANRRLQYARELRRHVAVDIYGTCGELRCARGTSGRRCDTLLRNQYKFYLSFENSNCEYYITEKLFWNALFNDVVPIVMGARKADYLATAPPHSFIHVEDFNSAQQLADYLLKLDQDDHLYNQYFLWKATGSFINTKFWCRMCAMLHDVNKPAVWYRDVEQWWRHDATCTRDRWDRPADYVNEYHL